MIWKVVQGLELGGPKGPGERATPGKDEPRNECFGGQAVVFCFSIILSHCNHCLFCFLDDRPAICACEVPSISRDVTPPAWDRGGCAADPLPVSAASLKLGPRNEMGRLPRCGDPTGRKWRASANANPPFGSRSTQPGCLDLCENRLHSSTHPYEGSTMESSESAASHDLHDIYQTFSQPSLGLSQAQSIVLRCPRHRPRFVLGS